MKDSWFRNPRPWHRTLPQSLDNPLQVDRLPDASQVELEYPVVQHKPSENRRYTLWVFLFALVIGVASFGGQLFFSGLGMAPFFQVFFTSGALLLFLTQVPLARFSHRLLLCLVVWPITAAICFAIADRYLDLALGVFAAAFLADRVASHFFYTKTAMPMPKSEAFRLRLLWSRRFLPLSSTARGVELYWLTILGKRDCYDVLLKKNARNTFSGGEPMRKTTKTRHRNLPNHPAGVHCRRETQWPDSYACPLSFSSASFFPRLFRLSGFLPPALPHPQASSASTPIIFQLPLPKSFLIPKTGPRS